MRWYDPESVRAEEANTVFSVHFIFITSLETKHHTPFSNARTRADNAAR